MLTSSSENLDVEQATLIEWLNYVDAAGYVDLEDYLKLSPKHIQSVIYIRTAGTLKEYKQQLMDTKDKDTRHKLNLAISEIEKIFDG